MVALELLDPDRTLPAAVVSCNMYADRAETIILGKAAQDAVAQSGKRVVAVAVTAFSNRMWTRWINPKEDQFIRRKMTVEPKARTTGEGRLEDVSQLARQFTAQAHGDSRMKAIWWLSACLGQSNDFIGTVYDYRRVRAQP